MDAETRREAADVDLHAIYARVWAAEWVRIAREIEAANDGRQVIDEGWMIAWFANAIMAGYDIGRARLEAEHRAALQAEPDAVHAHAGNSEFDKTRHAYEDVPDAETRRRLEAIKLITDERDESRLVGRDQWADALDLALAALQAAPPSDDDVLAAARAVVDAASDEIVLARGLVRRLSAYDLRDDIHGLCPEVADAYDALVAWGRK
jgi:hypothetical protein